MEFVSWVENSALGIWMLDSIWGYPIVLSAHAVGMSIVVGTVLMIDLRVLGYAGDAPLQAFRNMFYVTWFGVFLNFASGVALFASDPAKFLYHPVFWTKIGLMVLGVLSVYLLWGSLSAAGAGAAETRKVKNLARISMLLWLGVIIAGRLIGYMELE